MQDSVLIWTAPCNSCAVTSINNKAEVEVAICMHRNFLTCLHKEKKRKKHNMRIINVTYAVLTWLLYIRYENSILIGPFLYGYIDTGSTEPFCIYFLIQFYYVFTII